MGAMENYEAFYQQPETTRVSNPVSMPDLRKVLLNPEISLTKEDNGFGYVMYYGPEDKRRVYVSGWSAGTRREAVKEAMVHAGEKQKGF